MIACVEYLDEDELALDLPGAPYTTVNCLACRGLGAQLSLHPLYGGAEPCEDCLGMGEVLAEEEGDSA